MLLGNVETLRMERRIMTAMSSVSYLPSVLKKFQRFSPPRSLLKNPNLSTRASKVMQKGAVTMVTVGIDMI